VELGKLTGHSKKVSAVSFVGGPEAFVTGSADQTVRLWKGTEDRCVGWSCCVIITGIH
jgi:pre-mRNA-processing factor 19